MISTRPGLKRKYFSKQPAISKRLLLGANSSRSALQQSFVRFMF
jgi:hypothetical protein